MRLPLAKLNPAARNGTRFGWPGRFMWFTSCLKDVVRPTCTRCVRQIDICELDSTLTSIDAWSSVLRQGRQGPDASTSCHFSLLFVAE